MLPGSPFVAWTRPHRFTTRCQTTLPVQWRATTQDLSASLSAERNAYVEHCPAMFGRIMDTRQRAIVIIASHPLLPDLPLLMDHLMGMEELS